MRRQREEAGRRKPEKRTGTMQFEEIRRRLLSLLENRDELSDQDILVMQSTSWFWLRAESFGCLCGQRKSFEGNCSVLSESWTCFRSW